MRALLVSYVFPPVGGAGVGRTLKLAKYLPDHGVEAAVMTCANPSVPVFDESLMRDVRLDMERIEARTFEPGYGLKKATWEGDGAAGDGQAARGLKRRLIGMAGRAARAALVPDPQILWQPHAQLVLGRRLAARKDDVVFISGPPFSQFLLAPLARARPGTAVVLDYRDEWTTYRNTYEMMGRASAMVGASLERSWCARRTPSPRRPRRSASACWATSRSSIRRGCTRSRTGTTRTTSRRRASCRRRPRPPAAPTTASS